MLGFRVGVGLICSKEGGFQLTDEDRVGNNLLQISKLRFGQKAKLLFRL